MFISGEDARTHLFAVGLPASPSLRPPELRGHHRPWSLGPLVMPEILHGAGGVGSAGEEPFRASSQLASSSKIWFDFFPERSTNPLTYPLKY